MSKDPDVFGTGRMLSPITSPDGSAVVIYKDDDVTIWLYPLQNTVRVQTPLQDKEKIALVKSKVKSVLQQAIRDSKLRIENAKKTIAHNQRDINGYSLAVLEIEKIWPDEEDGDTF